MILNRHACKKELVTIFTRFFFVLVTLTAFPFAVNATMIIDYEGELSNGLKTTAKGTINSIADLSNGSFKVSLLTKSEQDPQELENFIIDGPIQVTSSSVMTAVSGEIIQERPLVYRFNVSDDTKPLPTIHISNVGVTKAGQGIDMRVSITNVVNNDSSDYLQLGQAANGSLNMTMSKLGGFSFSVTFFQTGISQPIELLMFPAINDIDYAQCFKLEGIPLGYGANLSNQSDGSFSSDGTPVNGIADFPLGGIIYQVFGSSFSGSYSSQPDLNPTSGANGFDIFGAYGTVDDVEVTKPDFGEVIIPKASWTIDDTSFIPGEEIIASLNQPINSLDEDINHRYDKWTTRLTIPTEIKNPTVKLLDGNGYEWPLSISQNGTVITSEISTDTMKQMLFSGETYQFIVTGKLSEELMDQTTLTFKAETHLDGKADVLNYITGAVDHKKRITVKYYRQDTTDSVIKSTTSEFGYGLPWSIAPAEAPEGYYFDEESTVDALSGERVDFPDKTITLYYAPLEKLLVTQYLDETGDLLAETSHPINYLEAYTTTANDLDDDYSLLTNQLPENASGVVGNKDVTVTYYYRSTKGHWVTAGEGTRVITRLDYHGHIRSNSINYSDGVSLTLLNEADGYMLYHDTVDEGAVADYPLTAESTQEITLNDQEKVKIIVGTDGIVQFERTMKQLSLNTTIINGNYTHIEKSYSNENKLLEQQSTIINGVTGQIISKETEQYLEGSFKVIAKQETVKPMESLLNKSAANATPTNFETEVVGTGLSREIGETQDEEVQMQRSLMITEEDVMAENVIEFDQHLTGSATNPISEDYSFSDSSLVGDLEDDVLELGQLKPSYLVSVYEGEKKIKEDVVPEGESLDVELPSKEKEKKKETVPPIPDTIEITPKQNKVALQQNNLMEHSHLLLMENYHS